MSQSSVNQYLNTSTLYFKLMEADKIVITATESSELLAELKSLININTLPIIKTLNNKYAAAL